MLSSKTKSKSRREGGALSTRASSARARREADLSQRRAVVDSSDEGERENVRPPDDPVPSTSGLKVREDIALKVPVRVVVSRLESTGREPEEAEPLVIEDDRVLTSDTDVEFDEREEEMDGEKKAADSGSDGDTAPLPEKVRKRGRPPTNPAHDGLFTADVLTEKARLRKEREWEREQLKALDPATEVGRGPRLKKARKEEQELLLEFKETSAAGLTAIVNEQVAALRKVAQGRSNLKCTTIKALWDTSISIAAATAALNMRAQTSGNAVATPEWDDLREELRQLRADMTHLRSSNDTLKEELRRERVEREKLERLLEKEREERKRDM